MAVKRMAIDACYGHSHLIHRIWGETIACCRSSSLGASVLGAASHAAGQVSAILMRFLWRSRNIFRLGQHCSQD